MQRTLQLIAIPQVSDAVGRDDDPFKYSRKRDDPCYGASPLWFSTHTPNAAALKNPPKTWQIPAAVSIAFFLLEPAIERGFADL
jgi:hypothetical protein